MSFDFEKFADEIENSLKGNCFGYAFVVSYKTDWKVKRANGLARTKHNPPETAMSTNMPFHTASVSKAVTAVALLKLLNQREDVSLDSNFYHYLPVHWQVHSSIKDITFRQLLTHTSGLRTHGIEYSKLKKVMHDGLDAGATKVYNYEGINFALMRILIPALAKYPVIQDAHGGGNFDIIQAAEYASFYIDYVRKELFEKADLPKLNCEALPYISGVCYHFPEHGNSGTDFGDQTLTCGSRGWVMSAAQMAKFFRMVHHTENILPAWLSRKMRDDLLGYDSNGKTGDNVSFYWKNGGFPGTQNAGELNTLTIGYSNDVQVALVINSEVSFGKDNIASMINKAHEKIYKVSLVIKDDNGK